MSTALSTGRTGAAPSASESAATKRRAERERKRRPKVAQRVFAAAGNRRRSREPGASESAAQSGEPGKLKKATKKASHREAFFLSEFGSGRGVGFEKKGKAPDSA